MLRTLSLGGVAWNTMLYVDEFPQPHPQTVFARSSHTTVGSSGAGKALNFASLGASATLWGALGADEAADKVRAFMADAGVEMLEALDPEGTMRHVNLMDAAGGRISIFALAGSQELQVDINPIRRVAAGADVVSVTIMNYCRQFLPMLQGMGKDIWIDIHDYDGVNPYHAEFIKAATHLFMSSQNHPDWRGFLEERITEGSSVAVATHGADGASGLTADVGWVEVGADPVEEIVDTNGAGDGFFAGFAVAWSIGAGLAAALKAGAAQGARAVTSRDLAPR